jgi:hypothetical protein
MFTNKEKIMKKEKLIQQGDVLIFSNATIPQDAEEVLPVKGRLILAEGETTGHAHAIVLADYPNSRLFKSASGTFLHIHDPVVLGHEEHHAVIIPAGVHKIGIVQEVDPFSEEIRAVQD